MFPDKLSSYSGDAFRSLRSCTSAVLELVCRQSFSLRDTCARRRHVLISVDKNYAASWRSVCSTAQPRYALYSVNRPGPDTARPATAAELAPVSLDTTLSTGTEKEWPS